jgi:hypothetical protein
VSPRAKTAIRVGVSAALLAAVVWKVQARRVVPLLLGIDVRQLAAAALAYGACQLVSAARWRTLLLALRAPRRPIASLFGTYLVGMFFNNVLLGTVGGDVVKAILVRPAVGGAAAVLGVGLDRLFGLMAMSLLWLGCLAHVLAGADTPVPPPLVVASTMLAFLILCLGAVLALPPSRRGALALAGAVLPARLAAGVRRASDALDACAGDGRRVAAAFGLALAVQVGNIAVYVLLAAALDLHAGAAFLALFYPVATLATLVPVSVGGVGLRENVAATLFAAAGRDPAQGVSLALAWFGVTVGWSLVGGVLFAAGRRS